MTKKPKTLAGAIGLTAVLIAGFLLSSCASDSQVKGQAADSAETVAEGGSVPVSPVVLVEPAAPPSEGVDPAAGQEPDAPTSEIGLREASLFPGTGKFLAPDGKAPGGPRAAGDITLNFENTDIREVVKVIMGDLLGLNYVLDPRVKGGATLQTGSPLTTEELLPTMQTLLRMNGAALVFSGGVYRILPQGLAMRGTVSPQLGDSSKPLPQSYRVLVVPLRYISVNEMNAILAPLAPEGSIIRVDSLRNMLVLAGTGRELDNLLEAIRLFDVYWLKGLSVGFFPVQYVAVEDLLKDLDEVFGDREQGPFAGMLRLVPISSGNGLLAVTQNPEYLEEVKKWVERLDKIGASDSEEERLFVYRVRNSEAADLAALLTELFSSEGDDRATSLGRARALAPGKTPVTLESSSAKEGAKKEASKPRAASISRTTIELEGASAKPTSIKVVADEVNNSLLILATPRDYEKIHAALEKLDIVPLQVLIEATIIEVELTDEFEFGLEWFFQVNHGGDRVSEFSFSETGVIAPLVPGFNWSFLNSAAEIRANLSATVTDTRINVLSSPSVMVLDNQTARIQVGSSVPIATQSQVSTEGGSVSNSIEYRDTGVILSVTPRVNPGGLVIMEVEEDVSNAVDAAAGALNSPTIQTRNITSSVAVQNGQAVVLGGLIRENKSEGNSGVPLLHDIPVIGWAFGKEQKTKERTELLVIIEPSVVGSINDADAVIEDFRNRLQGLDWELLSSVKGRKIQGPKRD